MALPNKILYISFMFIFINITVFAETAQEKKKDKMTNGQLDTLIKRIDENAKRNGNYWQFSVTNVSVTIVTDETADRMRIIIPVIEAEKLDTDQLYRIMQANFDSALDARYAIAKNILWSAYIHPLSLLNDEEFLIGLGQTVNLVTNFGTSYSSGLLTFRGGDSESIREKQLIQELIEKGQAI